jgi:hypothetical protein
MPGDSSPRGRQIPERRRTGIPPGHVKKVVDKLNKSLDGISQRQFEQRQQELAASETTDKIIETFVLSFVNDKPEISRQIIGRISVLSPDLQTKFKETIQTEEVKQIIETNREIQENGLLKKKELNVLTLKISVGLLIGKIIRELKGEAVKITDSKEKASQNEKILELEAALGLLTTQIENIGKLSESKDNKSETPADEEEFKQLMESQTAEEGEDLAKKYMKYKLKYLKLKNELKNRS